MNSVETLERMMPQRYSYSELERFTSNFAEKIGFGQFSEVYKGRLPDGVEVAVKVVHPNNDLVGEVFEARVLTMATTHHQHLIKLYGFSSDSRIKAVVYEFMENGSLDSILSDSSVIIEWEKLYLIAINVAKVFDYLHNDCDNRIILGNFTPCSVLVDANFCPKLTLFRTSGLMETNDSHHSDSYHSGSSNHSGMGGNGMKFYTAPEVWISASRKTSKFDVYAFGIMLLEILGRFRTTQVRSWFPKVVWEKLEKDCFEEILADCGISEADRDKATILATLAIWCIQYTAKARPSMSTVVAVLEKEMHLNMPPNPFFPSSPAISMQPEMGYTQVDSSISEHSVDSEQNCDRVKEEATKPVPDINVGSGFDIHQNTESTQEQLMPDTYGRGDVENKRKLEKFLLYVEKKRSITNEVCGSILAKLEELKISCNIFEEERKIKESRRYVEMKQSITDEVCESILKIMEEV